jgi:predicted MPP superfamily phosphohydrolase
VTEFRILHLSDIHFGAPGATEHQDLFMTRLAEALDTEIASNGKIDLVALTGDLVWGADVRAISVDNQWDLVDNFIRQFEAREWLSPHGQIILVPGNHDLQRGIGGKLLQDFLANPDQHKFDSYQLDDDRTTWNLFVSQFSRFGNTLSRNRLPGAGEFGTDGFFTVKVPFEKVEIGIGVFNTSFLAIGDKRNLLIGSHQFYKIVNQLEKCNFKIALSHHPTPWLDQPERERFERSLEEEFQLHLYGHEHKMTVNDSSIQMRIGAGATYQEAGELQTNYFSILGIDFSEKKARLRAWEISLNSGRQWRPCTQSQFVVSTGDFKNLQTGALFPKSGEDASFGGSSGRDNFKSAGNVREALAHLETKYGYRWENGDFEAETGLTCVFWPVRLRPPTVIHAAQAFTAAILQSKGAKIILAIDDLGADLASTGHFEHEMKRWIELAGGQWSDVAKAYFKEELENPLAAAKGWATVRNWWRIPDETLLNVLKVSKLIVEDDDLPKVGVSPPRKLMNAAMVWAAIAHLSSQRASGMSVITLCGDDERLLWETWRLYVDDADRPPTGHLYLPSITGSTSQPYRMDTMNLSWSSAQDVERTINEMFDSRNDEALKWFARQCVNLLYEMKPNLVKEVVLSDRPTLQEKEKLINMLKLVFT